MTKRADSSVRRRLAKIMPVSAALIARESFMPESAVRRLLCATTAMAAASEPNRTRNIIARTDATARRSLDRRTRTRCRGPEAVS
jgi:hypothetical protein